MSDALALEADDVDPGPAVVSIEPKALETVLSVRLDRGLENVLRSTARARDVSVSAMLRVAIDVVLAMSDEEFAAQLVCRACNGSGRRMP